MRAFLLLTAALLPACSISQLTKPGQQVSVVTSLPPDQASRFSDIGTVVVEQPSQFRGDEDDALNQLRNYAARDGAELVLLQNKGREPCEINSKESCLFLRGRKLRRADTMERPSEEL